MDRVRWGILGVGDVCEVKSGPGFYKAAHSELRAVMRRHGDKAADFARRHGVPKWYDDADALLADPEIDAVYVASPPSTHKELVLTCAEAGKPVLCEKPMALNVTEAREMIAACDAAGVPLWVAYYRRYLPRFRRILQFLSEGAIGIPRGVTVRLSHPTAHYGTGRKDADAEDGAPGEALQWRVDPKVAGGGIFLDMGSHMMDFLNYAFGDAKLLGGAAANQGGYYPAEDCVVASFSLPGTGVVARAGAPVDPDVAAAAGTGAPILGSGLWCFTTGETADEIAVYGSAGSIRFSCFDTTPVVLRRGDTVEELTLDNPPHVHQPTIEACVAELRGGPACESTGKTALAATEFMEGVLKVRV
ncbi:MAG: Gfo/Idh/MocA family protein [Spirochaetaceae bacterium]